MVALMFCSFLKKPNLDSCPILGISYFAIYLLADDNRYVTKYYIPHNRLQGVGVSPTPLVYLCPVGVVCPVLGHTCNE